MEQFKIHGELFKVQVSNGTMTINEQIFPDSPISTGTTTCHLLHQHKSYEAELLSMDEKRLELRINGKYFTVERVSKAEQFLKLIGQQNKVQAENKQLKAPMSGRILSINVTEGQEVKEGQALLVLEAMKMENIITAERDGIIEKVMVKPDQRIEKNSALLKFK